VPERLTPFLWILFSVGGTIAAFLDAPSYEALRALVQHPVVRLYLFVVISLPLFHWAHRFRYTLYDGLQLYHLTVLIAVLCYGAALVGTAVAAYTLWNLA